MAAAIMVFGVKIRAREKYSFKVRGEKIFNGVCIKNNNIHYPCIIILYYTKYMYNDMFLLYIYT